MATLVSFHAHPDDESIIVAGTLRRAADQGHRVVLVFATRGELGEVEEGLLDQDEPLWRRRVAETMASAEILGAARTEFLGYVDSGMMGEPSNNAVDCFWQAPVDEAARRVADILREEAADVLTVYDDNGFYGHPDHIQVNRVGTRAAGMELPPEASEPPPENMGKPEREITARFDVSDFVDRKRDSMRAHASQIGENHGMLTMPDEAFRYAFGTEWAIRAGRGPGITETDPMAGIGP